MNIFTFFLSLTFLTLVLADEPATEQAFQIPMWAIIVVGVIIAVLLLILGYFIIRRYSAKKQTVDTFNELEKHPSTKSDTTTTETIGSFNKTTHSVYKPAMIDQEKLSLPLPPPSTSLFSDKMELNSDDAMKLFEQYTQTDRTKGNGLQQKMGTIRSTLKQSLRRTKSKSRKPDVNHMFDTTTATPKRTSTDLPRTSLSTMSQHTSTTLQASLPGLPLLQDPNSTKTFKSTSIAHHDQDITTTNDNDNQPNFSTDSLPISVSSPLTPSPSPPIPSTPSPALPSYINNSINNNNNNSSPSPSPPPPPSSEKEITDSDPDPIHAARRAIRSASRKSKTRSTLLNEDDVLNLFKQEEEWAAKFSKHNNNNKNDEDDSEDGDTTRFKNKDRQRASISYGYTTISGKSANHTRYITDEMLEKRANTIGRSYQVSSPSQQQQKSSNLETLFTSPLPKKNQPLSPGNEKLEMVHPFEALPVPTTKSSNDIDSDKIGSSKYAIPDELLYQQNNGSSSSITHGYLQKRPSLATEITSTSNNINNNNNGFLDSPYISSSPSSTINNNNRHRNSIVSNGRKTVQDRMDNFEGKSDQTGSTGHSRKSSGSAATMIRISQQHSQTWSGRSPYMRGAIPQHQRNPNNTSSSPYDEDDENDGFRERTTPIPTPTLTRNHHQQQQNGDDDDESLHTKQPMFYTMRSTKPKQRNGLPSWYSPPDDDIPTPSTRHKTPAERERDEYLNTLYGNPRQ